MAESPVSSWQPKQALLIYMEMCNVVMQEIENSKSAELINYCDYIPGSCNICFSWLFLRVPLPSFPSLPDLLHLSQFLCDKLASSGHSALPLYGASPV